MILVTGASGFIGRSLVRALDQAAVPHRAYTGRVNQPMQLRDQLAGIETVYHLASAEMRGRPRLLEHVDVEGTERLIEECRRAGVRRLIVMSRLGAEPNSIYPLLRAKGQVELRVRRSGLRYTIVRSASLFGVDDRFLNTIAALAAWTWPFVWLPGGGDVALQPLWVEDLVHCLVSLLERPDLVGESVIVAGEERYRYRDLAGIVLATANMRRRPLRVDLRLTRAMATLTMSWWVRPPVTKFWLDRFSVPDVAPLDSLLRTFGFRPGRLLENVAYLRKAGQLRHLFRL
jgi:NADH dehydrogenase